MFPGGGVNLGSAYGAIYIDQSGIDAGLQEAQRAFDNALANVGTRLSQFGDSVANIGGSLTLLTAPLTAFGVKGVRTAATFQQAMTEISARTGLVGEDLERVRQFALQMGADTVFSGQQAADAFLQLLTSGQSVEEAIATLPMVLEAAAAGGEDLGRTADTLTDIMAAFGLDIDRLPPRVRALADSLGVTNAELVKWSMQGDEIDRVPASIERLAAAMEMTVEDFYIFLNSTEDASTVVESLARAAGASSADMASLGQGFANVGPVARNFGMSVDQTAAALAILAENGIKGAESGTALKSMLLNMSRNTEPVQKAWDKLGLSLYDANGNIRNINTVLLELDRALDALPVEEQNRLMQDLAGSYGIVALSALRGEVAISSMQRMMEEQASAGEVASAMMDTWNVRLDSLMGSLQTLQIEALTPLMEETLGPFIEQVTQVINGVTDWVRENPQLTSTIVMVAGALAALGPTLLVVGKAISAVGGLLTGLGKAVVLLTSPLGIAIGLAAAFAAAYTTNFLGLRDLLEPVITTIGEGLSRLVMSIGWFIDDIREFGLAEAIRGIFGLGDDERGESWLEGVLVAFGMARDTAVAVVETIGNAAQPVIAFVEQISTLLDTFFSQLDQGRPFLQSLYTAFLVAFGPDVARVVYDLFTGIERIVGAALDVIHSLFDFLGKAWAIVAPALGELFNWFTQTALPAVVGFVTNVVLPVIAEFINILGRVWNAVAPALLSLLDWFINTGLPAIVNIINTYVLPVVEAFFNFIGGVWALVEPALSAIGNWFLDSALPAIVGFIRDVVVREVEFFINLLRTIWQVVSPPLTSLYNWFANTFRWIGENFIKPVVDFVGSLIREVERAFDALSRLLGLSNQPFAYTVPERPPVSVQGPTQLPGAPSMDSGGRGIAGLPYLIGTGAQPELFVPETNGQFFPADQWMRMLAGAGDQYQITVMMPPEALASPALAEQRGRDFGAALAEELRRRG